MTASCCLSVACTVPSTKSASTTTTTTTTTPSAASITAAAAAAAAAAEKAKRTHKFSTVVSAWSLVASLFFNGSVAC